MTKVYREKKSSFKLLLQIKNEILKNLNLTRYETMQKPLKCIEEKTGFLKIIIKTHVCH